MKKYWHTAALVAALALVSGCEQPSVVSVKKADHDKVVSERDGLIQERDKLKEKVSELEKRKTEIISGFSREQCTELANEIVAKSCTSKAVAGTRSTGARRNVARSTTRGTGFAPSAASASATATGGGTATATATANAAAAAAPPPISQQSSMATSPQMTQRIWLWHAHDATAENPKPCVIASGNGEGLPPYCSNHSVNAPRPGETKPEWLLRVGGGKNPTDTGLYQKAGKAT